MRGNQPSNEKDIPGYPPSGENRASDDTRRTRILQHLAESFPSGAETRRMTHYIAELAKLNFKIADVREGAERVIHTRENATFPPFAVLLRGCTEARADRMRAERANAMLDDDGAPSQRRDLSPRGIASSLSEFRSLRAEVKEILSERRTNTPVITPEPEEEPWECPF